MNFLEVSSIICPWLSPPAPTQDKVLKHASYGWAEFKLFCLWVWSILFAQSNLMTVFHHPPVATATNKLPCKKAADCTVSCGLPQTPFVTIIGFRQSGLCILFFDDVCLLYAILAQFWDVLFMLCSAAFLNRRKEVCVPTSQPFFFQVGKNYFHIFIFCKCKKESNCCACNLKKQ